MQTNAVGMGAIFAPNYANLFMCILKEVFVYGTPPGGVKHRWCYIDNCLIVWEGDKDGLETNLMNSNNK